jgi:hypothetical protein
MGDAVMIIRRVFAFRSRTTTTCATRMLCVGWCYYYRSRHCPPSGIPWFGGDGVDVDGVGTSTTFYFCKMITISYKRILTWLIRVFFFFFTGYEMQLFPDSIRNTQLKKLSKSFVDYGDALSFLWNRGTEYSVYSVPLRTMISNVKVWHRVSVFD